MGVFVTCKTGKSPISHKSHPFPLSCLKKITPVLAYSSTPHLMQGLLIKSHPAMPVLGLNLIIRVITCINVHSLCSNYAIEIFINLIMDLSIIGI